MFVETHRTLAMPADEGRRAIEAALASHALDRRSSEAVAHGVDLALQVGPRGEGGVVSKEVRARILDTRRVGITYVIPLRWEAIGSVSRFYPALDANIGITPVDDAACIVSMVGSYTPPLGAFGSTLDRAALARVATATVESFLDGLVSQARQERPAPV